jgi:hypothetical protein
VANLRNNPAIEINVVDPFARKGYRFKGTAEIHATGETYGRGLEVLRQRGYGTETVRHIVLVTVERALPLLSPVYASGAAEEDVRARWREYYSELLADAETGSTSERLAAKDGDAWRDNRLTRVLDRIGHAHRLVLSTWWALERAWHVPVPVTEQRHRRG